MTIEDQKTLTGCRVLDQKSEALMMQGSLQNSEDSHLGREFATGLEALGTEEG